MNVIIVSRFLKSPKLLCLHRDRRFFFGTGGVVCALALAVFAAGFFARGGAALAQVRQMRAQLASEQAQAAATKADAQRQVNAMAVRLGELQAQANRLNALGERLVRMGKIDDGEFNFNAAPGTGGEQQPTTPLSVSQLDAQMNGLGASFAHAGDQLQLLDSLLSNRELDRSQIPSAMPLVNTFVSAPFGSRIDPITGGHEFHKGMDLSGTIGDPIHAAADGIVVRAELDSGGYGNVVDIVHADGYATRYGHCSKLLVKAGDLVHAGDVIAKVGTTGRSTGPHLHFEVWHDGAPVNPQPFLKQIGR
ncbi:MAG: M23 family metallopeptidase [Proteobacteria bacterium]|nr:M23 family metallopeptidase [Pseudomonadota bacterium]MBS0464018.1 M23 family metallopeptidase [Pseudomonadota bacterium]